nr:MAG TPA: hypothetical protein [Bacteriophage sp.]
MNTLAVIVLLYQRQRSKALRNDLCMSDDRASAFISTAKVFLRSNPQSLRWIAGLYSKFGS